MDMKSYILAGGGLLICLVLLHALVSAWRSDRRARNADGTEADPESLDTEAEDGAEMPWNDAEAELTGEPTVEEVAAAEAPGPPVLMDGTADPATAADGYTAVESEDSDAGLESSMDSTALESETFHAPPPSDDAIEIGRKGRRIEIAGKRTEPTVPRGMRTEFDTFAPPTEPKEPRSEDIRAVSPDDVIIIWVFAKPGRELNGEALLKAFVSHGLKCDQDRLFKKADPVCGGPWYTVANGVEPGTFEISRPAALETPGIVMLLNLAEVRDPGPAFDNMLDVAQDIAISFDAELKDELRSDMSAQTIEHCRQRIRDYRRMLLRA